MEFTLEQLSPETVTMIFSNAYYQAEDNLFRNDESDEEVAVSTAIASNGYHYSVWSDVEQRILKFVLNLNAPEDLSFETKLKVSNIYDSYPVHAHVWTTDEGKDVIQFVYQHIVPEGVGIGPREIVGVFRIFEQNAVQHARAFNRLAEQVA